MAPHRVPLLCRIAAHSLSVCLLASACAEAQSPPEPAGPPTIQATASGTDQLLQAVSYASDAVAWVSGHGGAVVHSADGGHTWTTVPGPALDSLQFRDVHAFSESAAVLLSAGPGPLSRLYRTDDAGVGWTLAFLMEDERGFLDCLDFWDAERGFAYGDSFDGVPYILLTSDGGRTWQRPDPTGLPAALDGEGGFAASGTCARSADGGVGWIATGAGGAARVLRTADYGATWTAVDAPVVTGDAAGLTTIAFARDGETGLALGGDLAQMDAVTDNAVVSVDGGRTWTVAATPAWAGPVYGADLSADGGFALAVGPSGASYSLDRGTSWQALDSLNYWAVALSPDGQAGLMTGPEGRVSRVQRGGS